MIERPLDPPDDILGLCLVADTVVAYNSHYWRRFSLTGKQIEEVRHAPYRIVLHRAEIQEYFSVALPVILEMVFLSEESYVAVDYTSVQCTHSSLWNQ